MTTRLCSVCSRARARRRRVCCALAQLLRAPLHVPPVEFELCFGDVVVVLLDGLGITGASLVGGGLGEGVADVGDWTRTVCKDRGDVII